MLKTEAQKLLQITDEESDFGVTILDSVEIGQWPTDDHPIVAQQRWTPNPSSAMNFADENRSESMDSFVSLPEEDTHGTMSPLSSVIVNGSVVSSDSTYQTPQSEIALRYLVPQDIDNVKALCREIFPIEYPDYWYTEITCNQNLYALAAATWDKNKIVGLMVAEEKTLNQCNAEDRDILPKSLPANTLVSYILSLGVSRSYRCRGIASRLLDHYLQYITGGVSPKSRQVKAVYLHVLCTNQQAIRFYQKRHFRKHIRLKDYYHISERLMDGYTYVLYVNGGSPPGLYLYDCLKIAAGLILYPLRRLFLLVRHVLAINYR